MTYSQPVPNTKKLYIYNTNKWDIPKMDKDTLSNPLELLSAKQSKNGAAGPVGVNQPAQLYVTPDEETDLSLAGLGGSYIWVCEKEYTQFGCTESLIVPYTDDLHVKLGLRSVTPLGYWSAMKKSISFMQNWVKYATWNSDTLRPELLDLNYKIERDPNWKKSLTIMSITMLLIICMVLFYLFKK
jgi:hypothetical protein